MARQRSRDDDDDLDYGDTRDAVRSRAEASASNAIKLPPEVTAYEIDSAGWINVDILPYPVGKVNPHKKEGQYHYELSYKRHNRIGPEEKDICCLSNWGEACPVCEEVARLLRSHVRGDDASWQNIKDHKPKDRQLFCLLDRDVKGPRPQVLEYSWAMFGQTLNDKVDAGNEKNGYLRFYYLKGGMTVRAKFNKKQIGANSCYECTTIEFEPREQDIPKSIMAMVPCLDDLLVRLSYDAATRVLTGRVGRSQGRVEEEPPRRSRGDDVDRPSRRQQEDERPSRRREEPPDDDPVNTVPDLEPGDFVKHCKHGRCEVVKVEDDGRLVLKDEDGAKLRNINPADVTVMPDDEDPEPEKPAARKGETPARNGRKQSDDKDDDWENDDKDAKDDDEEPEKPATRRR